MESKVNKDVIGVVDPVMNEVENIGNITSKIQQLEPNANVVEEVRDKLVESKKREDMNINNVIGVVKPVMDEVENIGKITPE